MSRDWKQCILNAIWPCNFPTWPSTELKMLDTESLEKRMLFLIALMLLLEEREHCCFDIHHGYMI